MESMPRWRSLAATSWSLVGAVLMSAYAANAAGNYDGNGTGPTIVAVNGDNTCVPWDMGAQLSIVDGKFNQEVHGAPMHGAIAPDGSFSVSGRKQLPHQTIAIHFEGRIAGDQLNAVWQSKSCTYNMTLHRQ